MLVAVVKLVVAARTQGTNDLLHWAEFASGVRERGPVGVYAGDYPAVYNHPPLIGWWLAGIDALSSSVSWLPLRLLVRAPAVVADVACAVLVFELLRTRRSLRVATAAGVLVAASPVLFVISGFHGNTDPVFVLLTLAAGWLLVDRQRPVAAGVALGLALSVKLVPVVAVPVLLVAAVRGRYGAGRLVAGGAAVFAVLWLPVLLRQWTPFAANVLGYEGTLPAESPWGLPRFGRWLGIDAGALDALHGPGRFAILLACCLLPAVLVRRRPADAPYGIALALALFTLLTPTWGPQYLAWAVAAGYLLNPWTATAYNLAAGVLLVETYTRWAGGFPWDFARAAGLDAAGLAAGVVAWLALAATVGWGVRDLRRPRAGESGPGDRGGGVPAGSTVRA